MTKQEISKQIKATFEVSDGIDIDNEEDLAHFEMQADNFAVKVTSEDGYSWEAFGTKNDIKEFVKEFSYIKSLEFVI